MTSDQGGAVVNLNSHEVNNRQVFGKKITRLMVNRGVTRFQTLEETPVANSANEEPYRGRLNLTDCEQADKRADHLGTVWAKNRNDE